MRSWDTSGRFGLTASGEPPGAGLRSGWTAHLITLSGCDIGVTSIWHLTDIIIMSYTGHMDIERHVQAIQSDLATAAALGDEAAVVAGERLAAAVGSSLQLRLFDVLTEVTLALNAQLSSGHVEIRLAGRDPELVLVDDRAGEGDSPPAPGDDLSARITLRLPEALKSQIEAVASSEGVSANAWIVRALSRALEPRRIPTRSGNRLQGFAHS
jgi:hypothetical protein